MKMAKVSLKNVSYSYSDGIGLKNITITIRDGERIGLIGPNGSGKTTLLKLISGILLPSEGEIYLDGINLKRLNRRTIAQEIAVVPQQFNLPFAFTVKEVVELGRTPFFKMFADGNEDVAIVNRAIAALGIEPLAGRFFNELSGGERQKVVLAMALAQQPKLFLLDEPTAHLDINHQIEIFDWVKKLNSEVTGRFSSGNSGQAITVVAAIHDLNLAALYFERLILLKEGHIVADGTPHEILTSELLSEVFSITVEIAPHPQTKTPQLILPVKDEKEYV